MTVGVAPPRASVLMPAYNAEATIGEAVQSALAQTVPDIEVIVVDDGSAQPIAEALAPIRDPRLRVLRTAGNHGVAAARNSALVAARAPVVAQLDADDAWRETHLEALLARMEDPDVGLAYANAAVRGHPNGLDRWIGAWSEHDGGPRPFSEPSIHPVNDLAVLYGGNPIPSPAVAIRTAAARAVGGYPPWLTVGEDYLLYIRLLAAGWRFAYVDELSAIYRWPEPGRGATFDRRRHARQGVKLFAALAVSSPADRAVRARLGAELKNVVTSHVPGSLPAWRALRRVRSRVG
jgi:glycosyltransferase involved in cell wall biosynthesis